MFFLKRIRRRIPSKEPLSGPHDKYSISLVFSSDTQDWNPSEVIRGGSQVSLWKS